jgi:hypothetical protein
MAAALFLRKASFPTRTVSSSSNGIPYLASKILRTFICFSARAAKGCGNCPMSIFPASSDSCIAENGTGVIFTSVSASPCLSSAAFNQRWPDVEKPLIPTILPLRSATDLIGELSLT